MEPDRSFNQAPLLFLDNSFNLGFCIGLPETMM